MESISQETDALTSIEQEELRGISRSVAEIEWLLLIVVLLYYAFGGAEPDDKPVFDVAFAPDSTVQPDPLIPYIPVRSVQRRRMRTRPLTSREKAMLESALGEGCDVLWLEGFAKKWNVARLMFDNSKLRLTLPEAYRVHREVIQWNARFSEDRVPDQAIGLDPLTTRLMRWVLGSWRRVEFFNRYLRHQGKDIGLENSSSTGN